MTVDGGVGCGSGDGDHCSGGGGGDLCSHVLLSMTPYVWYNLFVSNKTSEVKGSPIF